MSETAVETKTETTLFAGDRVKVATNAFDGAGYAVPSRILGSVGKLDFLDGYSGWYVLPEDGRTGAYVAAQYLTKFTETDELRGQVEKLTAEVAKLTVARDEQTVALDQFKTAVRNALVDKAESSYTDDAEPFDDLLATLDLEPRVRDFNVRVDLEGSFYTTIEATSLDEALSKAQDYGFVREYIAENIDGDWLDSTGAEEDE